MQNQDDKISRLNATIDNLQAEISRKNDNIDQLERAFEQEQDGRREAEQKIAKANASNEITMFAEKITSAERVRIAKLVDHMAGMHTEDSMARRVLINVREAIGQMGEVYEAQGLTDK